jgi:hypothetical protein
VTIEEFAERRRDGVRRRQEVSVGPAAPHHPDIGLSRACGSAHTTKSVGR